MTVKETLDKFIEFETKYRVKESDLFLFKEIVDSLNPLKFLYVEGPDYYYTLGDGSFARYRKAINEKRAELTFKDKPVNAFNNIIRKEINWRVDNTSKEEIEEGLLMRGFNFNFRIYKTCHIYRMEDATLVFYTVIDENKKRDHFVEIELDEHNIHKLTEDEAWDKIRKYEDTLSPLGITYRNRLNKSLFDMYKKDQV